MNVAINTQMMSNITRLPRLRLTELLDILDDPDNEPRRDVLIAVANELIEHDADSFDKFNLERMLYLLEENKPVHIREIRNVLLDYTERAIRGKRNGGKRRGSKSRKQTRRKSRKQRRL